MNGDSHKSSLFFQVGSCKMFMQPKEVDMAYTVAEFLEHQRKEHLEPPTPEVLATCASCRKPILKVHGEEPRMTSDGPVHEDCWFNDLGTEIEQHPIHRPGRLTQFT